MLVVWPIFKLLVQIVHPKSALHCVLLLLRLEVSSNLGDPLLALCSSLLSKTPLGLNRVQLYEEFALFAEEGVKQSQGCFGCQEEPLTNGHEHLGPHGVTELAPVLIGEGRSE